MLLRFKIFFVTLSLAFAAVASTDADVTVSVDSSQNWLGFMNVFETDESTYVFGQEWGFNDLSAVFGLNDLTLGPAPIGTDDAFWYGDTAGGPDRVGNKFMDASGYVEVTDAFGGMNVTFSGTVLSDSFTSAHTAVAYIRDFAPDYSSFVENTVALAPGDFTVSLMTNSDAGRHVQYGFNVKGVNVWPDDVGNFGNVVIRAVPEPGSLSFLGLAGIAVLARRRR